MFRTPSTFIKRLLLLLGSILICIAIQVSLFAGSSIFRSQAVQPAYATPSSNVTVPPTIQLPRSHFETGVVFPQWSQTSYGPSDTAWLQGISAIQQQTGARWLEMPILFSQSSPTSTQVTTGQSTPTVESVVAGIRAAHALGYHVFIVPLMGVIGAGEWAATIHFSSTEQAAQWFDSFWRVYQPYVVGAQVAGADQLSIGTEVAWLEQQAPAALWNTLITHVRKAFSKTISYDMNWTSLYKSIPAWMSNPDLNLLGVSEYIPLTDSSERVDPRDMFALWQDKVKTPLDAFSDNLGKPVIISEIGYRNSSDSLYQPWLANSTSSSPDPTEQAAACDAALANVIPDPHIAGIFFWGWDAVGGFKLAGQPAVNILRKWYTSSQIK